jgi:flagellar hook-associated protein 2
MGTSPLGVSPFIIRGGVLMSDQLRILGMASGLDTETMVKQLMKAETMKVDKVKQDKQIIQWQQDLYRDMIGDLTSLKSTYFDVLKPETNMLSQNSYGAFDVSSVDVPLSGSPAAVPGATATAGVGATAGVYKVEVTTLAAGAIKEGTVLAVNTTKASTLSSLGLAADTTINITYNGTTKPVTIKTTDTLDNVIQNISTATSGNVVAKYSELTRKFSIQTSATGISNTLSIDKNIDALKLNENIDVNGDIIISEGIDAAFKITPPGSSTAVDITKSTNTVTIDGVNYSLAMKNTTTNITLTSNTQKSFDKIKGFIDKYNELVDKVNKKIIEKKQYDYKPLTDEQKAGMEPEDIKKWEEKAKEGLLKNDSSLQNMLASMRSAFFQGVEGAGITLKDLGLNTSADYTQKGKIVFDQSLGGEQKLKDMLATRGDQVAKLFMQTSTKQSSYSPDLTTSQRADRNSDQGIFQRINDILQDNVRTTRNSSGKKGFLIEKAGIKGDFTEFSNLLYNQIKDKDKMIANLTEKLAVKESRYYTQFAKLEQAMNSLNSQSSWLAQQLGSGN